MIVMIAIFFEDFMNNYPHINLMVTNYIFTKAIIEKKILGGQVARYLKLIEN